MSRRDDLIAKYADDLRNKCQIEPDMALLKKVTIGCGPAIYDPDAELVAASQKDELERVERNFLIKKLGCYESPELMQVIDQVIDTYGRSNPSKFRAVVYYMLVKQFGKEHVYA